MTDYRERSTGDVKTESQIRLDNKNMSLPRVWNDDVKEQLGIDAVFETPRPEPSGDYKEVYRDGVEQDANNNWVVKWSERDMFSDTTEDGVTTTKAEHETAYQAKLDADAAESVRADRNALLAATDWRASSDLTLSDEWATYRQALRDVPSQSSFPHDVTWPTEP